MKKRQKIENQYGQDKIREQNGPPLRIILLALPWSGCLMISAENSISVLNSIPSVKPMISWHFLSGINKLWLTKLEQSYFSSVRPAGVVCVTHSQGVFSGHPQGSVLHCSVSNLDPSQSSSPNLTQARCRVLIPEPHSAEHSPQLDHCDQQASWSEQA